MGKGNTLHAELVSCLRQSHKDSVKLRKKIDEHSIFFKESVKK